MATLAQTILASKGTPASEPSESEADVAAHAAAEDVIKALDAKDHKALRRALKNLRTIDVEE